MRKDSAGKKDRTASVAGRLQSILQKRLRLYDRPIPKDRRWVITPIRVRAIKNGLIPIETFIEAAIWRRQRMLVRIFFQFLRNQMVGIPELPSPRIGNARQRAAARRSPVGRKDRLPHYQNSQLPVRALGDEPLHCGGPPQAYGSSRRDQENQTG